MAFHLVGAPHSGVHELLAALTAELGVQTAQLHPLMQALPSADSALPASPEASLPPLTPIALGKPPALAGRLELIVRLTAEYLIANPITDRSFILLRRPRFHHLIVLVL